MSDIAFTKVNLPWGWLSNMAPFPIITPPGILNGLDGKTFRTTEALFMAMRFDDLDIQKQICAENSPMGAKMLAKKYADKMTIQQRSEKDVDNMRLLLKLKVEQHNLQKQLLETGDATIIEDCTYRQSESGLFWGAAKVDGKWVGQNVLGNLWMDLRKSLR